MVFRSMEAVSIENSSKEKRFSFEPYLRDQKDISMLIVPMLYRGKPSGIIYFENDLLKGAFSKERQNLVQLLSGQFAVALQNARLVEELEQRVSERTLALASEKDRADNLLKNILPADTAEELKQKGKATSRYYENVTVMFTDFIGFTKVSERMHPEELVKMLDHYFRAFDQIISKYGMEKIKTIGDAYLCVSGLPLKSEIHASNAIRAAFDILHFTEKTKKEGKYNLELRIGLHSGPVIAGVVGENKFAFDIWGDTVNTASRIENHSIAGHINVTFETKVLLEKESNYNFESRGKIPAKNKGEIDMYFVNEKQENAPHSEEAIQYMLNKLEKELDVNLSYHSPQHTRDIMKYSFDIAKQEGCKEDELMLLKTAAAYHDSGFLISPDDHENQSCIIAKETLPGFGYSIEQIEQINKMILSTRIPQQPEDLLSQILCDADLYYLGTDLFQEIGERLFNEFKSRGIIKNEEDWNKLQISFLEAHTFHTETARKLLSEKKRKNLQSLKL